MKHTTLPHIAILGKDYDGRWVDVYEDKEAKIVPVSTNMVMGGQRLIF